MCCLLTQGSTLLSTPNKKLELNKKRHQVSSSNNKRVRFEAHRRENEIVELLPLCSELSDSEKSNRWVCAPEKEEARQSVLQDTRDCLRAESHRNKRLNNNKRRPLSFSQTYQAVYQVCHTLKDDDNDRKEKDLTSQIGPEVVTLLAVTNPAARGLEDHIVPHLGIQRRLVRRKTIRTVIKVHQHHVLQKKQERGAAAVADDRVVAMVSQSLTRPSRKFAQASGLADATVAMVEYSRKVIVAAQEKQSIKM